MTANLCPACRGINLPSARNCGACGTALGDCDTVPMPLYGAGKGAADADTAASALWLDDLGRPPGLGGAAPQREPRLPALALREVQLAPPLGASHRTAPASSLPPPPAASPAPAATATDPAARAAHKIARRAAVRRSRLGATPAPALTDVLVLDSDETARHQLCSLLLGFGFGVRSAASVAEASVLAEAQEFVAAFVDMPMDAVDDAALALFWQLRGGSGADAPAPLLVLVAARLRPLDRVRAELAGCNTILPKPVSRSSIARALDVAGIALPSDARHV